jgi:hypothetical protein
MGVILSCLLVSFLICLLICLCSPIHLIRSPPPLDALSTISLAFQLIDILPNKTYLQLVRHPYDETVAHELGVDASESEQDEFTGDDSESEG